jgi:hypothetical protein
MKQKIYEHHFKVGEMGTLEDLNLDALISEVEQEGYSVKQISTSCTNKHFPSQHRPDNYVHIFLLAEKP